MKRIDLNEVFDENGEVVWAEEVEVDVPDAPPSIEELVAEQVSTVTVAMVARQAAIDADMEQRMEAVARLADMIDVDGITNMAQAKEAIRTMRGALRSIRKGKVTLAADTLRVTGSSITATAQGAGGD